MLRKSRFFLFLLLLLSWSAVCLAAPVIRADEQYLDVNTGLYILNGNVYIEVGPRIITAGQAKVNIAAMEVWGSGGIKVTQDDILFSGNSVYVCGAGQQAAIDGNVSLLRNNLSICADKASYNWNTKIAVFSGNVRINQSGSSWSADTVSYNLETGAVQ